MSMDKAAMIAFASVTGSLSAARMFIGGREGYSAFCALGGLIASQAQFIETQVIGYLMSGNRVDWGVRIVSNASTALYAIVGLGGALAYELAWDGSISTSDLSSDGLMRMGLGAAAAIAGYYAAKQVGGMGLGKRPDDS